MARARRTLPAVVEEAGMPAEFLEPDSPVWESPTDLDWYGRQTISRARRDAVRWLARRRRFLQAVDEWARENRWTLPRYPHRADRARLAAAGVPVDVDTDTEQRALYLVHFTDP